MGVFSWITQDTGRSICASGNTGGLKPFGVTMVDNNNNQFHERNYEGYGEFGGKDFFELLAEMNGKTNRSEGIDLWYGDEPFISPNRIKTSSTE